MAIKSALSLANLAHPRRLPAPRLRQAGKVAGNSATVGSGSVCGFTLLELLAVIGIIAIIAGLLFAAISVLNRSARRRHAAISAAALVGAIKSYRAAYGKWPSQSQDAQDKTYVTPSNIVADLMNNPRAISFLEITDRALRNGCYTDPWGRPFAVSIDGDGDGNVRVECETASLTTNVLHETVAVLSWGPDPDDENMRVYSWEQ